MTRSRPGSSRRELRRVRKPAGRLVAGEFLDRHYVPIVDLLRYRNAARLELSGRPARRSLTSPA